MHLIAVFFLLVSLSFGQTLNIRQIDRVVDVSQNSQVQPVEWYRGESVRFNAYLWRFNEQIALPSTAQPILKAWRTNDLNTLYVNVTGTLVNAGQGEVRVTLTPAQANLPSGAYSFAYQIWDGTNYMGIGAQGQLRVIWSPAGDSIAYVGSSTINDFIPKPTNVWSNGWILASSTGGTTTFARAEQSITQLVVKAGSTMSGDLDWTNAGLTSLDFATFDAEPAGSIAARRMQWNADRSTLKLGLNSTINLDVGQQLMLYGKNVETNALSKGEVVFIFGASGDNPTIKRASHSSESLSSRTIGIMAETVASNNNGFVVTRGTLYNVDTSTFAQGDPLYLGLNGTMQTNLPTAPLHGVFLGVVERVGVNNGQIYVAVQNYQELRELSDVFVNGLANGNLLSYNSASSRWENKTISALGLATGTPIYSVAGLATGTPIYSVAGLATGTPIYSVAGLATGTPIYSIAGLATGTPIYSVAGLATGTPIYSVAGLATGTPIYAETDPIWNAQKSGYATGTPIYTVAGLATGTPLYSVSQTGQVDSIGLTATVRGAITFAGSGVTQTGSLFNFSATPTESDPVWTSAAPSYLSIATFQASQAMTNTILRVPASSKTNVLVLIDGAGIVTTQRILEVRVQ